MVTNDHDQTKSFGDRQIAGTSARYHHSYDLDYQTAHGSAPIPNFILKRRFPPTS